MLDAQSGASITWLPPSQFLTGPAVQLNKAVHPLRVAWGAGVNSHLHITAPLKAQQGRRGLRVVSASSWLGQRTDVGYQLLNIMTDDK